MPPLTRVGPLAVALLAECGDWQEALASRYGAFRLAGNEPADFALRLVAVAPAPDADSIGSLHAEAVEVEVKGDRWSFRARSFWGALELSQRKGEVFGPLHRHAVDFALRLLLTSELAGGLLLHGALLGGAEGAWLCAGPSGAGKSTLGRLFPESALCDELTFVQRLAGGEWVAHATPFWQGRPIVTPLRGVRSIRHGNLDRLSRLAPVEACRRLSAEVRWPPAAGARAMAFDLLAALVVEVETAQLEFRPTTAVWTVLAGEAA